MDSTQAILTEIEARRSIHLLLHKIPIHHNDPSVINRLEVVIIPILILECIVEIVHLHIRFEKLNKIKLRESSKVLPVNKEKAGAKRYLQRNRVKRHQKSNLLL